MATYLVTHDCLGSGCLQRLGGALGAIVVFIAVLAGQVFGAESDHAAPPNGCADCTSLTLDFQALCDTSAQQIRDGAAPKDVIEAVKQEIVSQVPRGTRRGIRRIGEDETRCYRAAKIDIHQYCERNGKPVADEDVFQNYEAVDITGNDPDVVPEVISEDYNEVVQSANSHSGFFGRLTVVIYWKKTPIDRIDLTADDDVLEPGESTTVRAKLICGQSQLKHHAIRFAVTSGPGKSYPHSANTGENAEATVQFTADDEGTSVVEARYENVRAQIEIRTQGCLWDIELAYEANVREAPHRQGGTLQCAATFHNLPLNKIDGVLYPPAGRDTRLFLPRFATARVIRNTLGGSAPAWILGPGHPNPERDNEPQSTTGQEKLSSVRLQLGSAPWDDSVWGWPGAPDTRWGVYVVVPMAKVRPREPFSLQTTFTDKKGSYRATWNFSPKQSESKSSWLGGDRRFGEGSINLPRIESLLGK
jgi:hypothetical protein